MDKKTKIICKAVIEVAREHPAIIAIYLFGSRGSGTYCLQSDIDLAVLLAEESSSDFPALDFIVEVENSTGLRADVTILNRAGELLKYEVRKNGLVIYDSSPFIRKRFEVLGRKKFEDFLYIHKRYVKKVLYGGA